MLGVRVGSRCRKSDDVSVTVAASGSTSGSGIETGTSDRVAIVVSPRNAAAGSSRIHSRVIVVNPVVGENVCGDELKIFPPLR